MDLMDGQQPHVVVRMIQKVNFVLLGLYCAGLVVSSHQLSFQLGPWKKIGRSWMRIQTNNRPLFGSFSDVFYGFYDGRLDSGRGQWFLLG